MFQKKQQDWLEEISYYVVKPNSKEYICRLSNVRQSVLEYYNVNIFQGKVTDCYFNGLAGLQKRSYLCVQVMNEFGYSEEINVSSFDMNFWIEIFGQG